MTGGMPVSCAILQAIFNQRFKVVRTIDVVTVQIWIVGNDHGFAVLICFDLISVFGEDFPKLLNVKVDIFKDMLLLLFL